MISDAKIDFRRKEKPIRFQCGPDSVQDNQFWPEDIVKFIVAVCGNSKLFHVDIMSNTNLVSQADSESLKVHLKIQLSSINNVTNLLGFWLDHRVGCKGLEPPTR